MKLRIRARPLAICCFLASGLLLGDVVQIKLKAWLAQQLLEQAWTQTRETGTPTPPWPWADTTPVARLVVPRLGIDQIILAGASGRNLAFGPTHVAPSAVPGAPGHLVLSGHRDTHFAFLAELQAGDLIIIEAPTGERRQYRVEATDVIDTDSRAFRLVKGFDAVSLVTCYPFLAPVPGTPLRFIATAVAVEASSA